jgi:hypothetical protein
MKSGLCSTGSSSMLLNCCLISNNIVAAPALLPLTICREAYMAINKVLHVLEVHLHVGGVTTATHIIFCRIAYHAEFRGWDAPILCDV